MLDGATARAVVSTGTFGREKVAREQYAYAHVCIRCWNAGKGKKQNLQEVIRDSAAKLSPRGIASGLEKVTSDNGSDFAAGYLGSRVSRVERC